MWAARRFQLPPVVIADPADNAVVAPSDSTDIRHLIDCKIENACLGRRDRSPCASASTPRPGRGIRLRFGGWCAQLDPVDASRDRGSRTNAWQRWPAGVPVGDSRRSGGQRRRLVRDQQTHAPAQTLRNIVSIDAKKIVCEVDQPFMAALGVTPESGLYRERAARRDHRKSALSTGDLALDEPPPRADLLGAFCTHPGSERAGCLS
jgi:hypothetical protein